MQVKLLMIIDINSGTRSTPAHMLQSNLTGTEIAMKCLVIRAISSKSRKTKSNPANGIYQSRGVHCDMEYGQNFNKNRNNK